MKRNEKKGERRVENFPVWTFEQAKRAVPYIDAVMRSIRETFLQMRFYRRRAERIAEFSTRATRAVIVAKEEATREADRLQSKLAEAAQELADLNVHCVEPAVGVAMIPFVDGEQLAWFVWELYADEGIVAWRYHHDPLTMRRPLNDMDKAPLALTSMV